MTDVQTPAEKYGIPAPDVELVGQDGNAFAIMGRVQKALRRAGYPQEALDEYYRESTSGDYNNLLRVAMKWTGEDIGTDPDYADEEDW